MLRQQYLPGENKGVIYVGTHGRGIFKSSNTSSIFDFSDNGDDTPVELLSIYPNPAESFVNVELSSDTKEFDVSIIDLMGKEVYSSYKTNNSRIDISSLEAGNYVVIVIADGNKQLGKFIKTK
jgi:hypothetical protein